MSSFGVCFFLVSLQVVANLIATPLAQTHDFLNINGNFKSLWFIEGEV